MRSVFKNTPIEVRFLSHARVIPAQAKKETHLTTQKGFRHTWYFRTFDQMFDI